MFKGEKKKNCKIDIVCNPVIILFPSYISLIRVLNVDIFEVMWNRHLGLWLNTLPCRSRGLTLPKPFFFLSLSLSLLLYFCDGDVPSLSPSSTSPLLPLLLSYAIILTIMMTTATVTLYYCCVISCFHVNRCADDAGTTQPCKVPRSGRVGLGGELTEEL